MHTPCVRGAGGGGQGGVIVQAIFPSGLGFKGEGTAVRFSIDDLKGQGKQGTASSTFVILVLLLFQ